MQSILIAMATSLNISLIGELGNRLFKIPFRMRFSFCHEIILKTPVLTEKCLHGFEDAIKPW